MNHTAEFCCYLDGQPDHLTPEHQLENYWTDDLAGRPLFLSQNCQLTHSGKIPRDAVNNAGLTIGFAAMENMAWVRHPATGAIQPFWIGPLVQSLLSDTRDEMPVSPLTEDYKRCLATAGILVSQDQEDLQRHKTTGTVPLGLS